MTHAGATGVGIIANPASGKDIRRLVAHASVFDNNEKINILQRILLALDAVGLPEVQIMPDYYGLGERALDGVKLAVTRPQILNMPVTANERDSTTAAARLAELGVGCIIVLGGDGTNRVVAKGCGEVPIIPVSTGTNNVFPLMLEGTIAGLVAGLIALGEVDAGLVSCPARRLNLQIEGRPSDIALVDVVTSSDLWIGTRAIWDPSRIQEIVLARAEPGSIGLSSVGSCLESLDEQGQCGMYLALGEGGTEVLAPLGPGLLARVAVQDYWILPLGKTVTLRGAPNTVALDGERLIEVYGRPSISVTLSQEGPRVVDIRRCMAEATRKGVFQRLGKLPGGPNRRI